MSIETHFCVGAVEAPQLEPSIFIEVLRNCVSSDTDGGAAWLNHSFSTADWNELLGFAGTHGFLPLLTKSMSRHQWEGVPLLVRDALVRRDMHHTKSTLTRIAALIELQRVFHRCGVALLAWKGPCLSRILYGGVALRESTDLDFLVQAKNLSAAIKVLENLGFEHHSKTGDARVDSKVERFDQELLFTRQSDQTLVELHTQVLPWQFASWQNLDAFMQKPVRVPLTRGEEILCLNPELLFMTLCGHAIKHGWEKLKWLADIHMFLESRDLIRWESVFEISRAQGHLDAVLFSVMLSSEVFGSAIPKALSLGLESHREARDLAKSVAEWLWAGGRGGIPAAMQARALGLLTDSRALRIKQAARRVLSPRLVDMRSGKGVQFARLHRIHNELGYRGVWLKAKASLRAIW
jgi:Uncharacterised nucleotidyltransferase